MREETPCSYTAIGQDQPLYRFNIWKGAFTPGNDSGCGGGWLERKQTPEMGLRVGGIIRSCLGALGEKLSEKGLKFQCFPLPLHVHSGALSPSGPWGFSALLLVKIGPKLFPVWLQNPPNLVAQEQMPSPLLGP